MRFYLATLNDKNDVTVFSDDIDMFQDWDNGIFRDNFNGNWPTLDGHLVYLETTADLENYNYYSIPVILNGVRSVIEALYDFKQSKYVVLGARRITSAGMPDKNLIKLKPGDRITTLMQKMADSEDDTSEVETDSFTLSSNWSLEDSTLPDGTYAYMFSMSDIQGNEALSDVSFIKIKDGQMTYGEPWAYAVTLNQRRIILWRLIQIRLHRSIQTGWIYLSNVKGAGYRPAPNVGLWIKLSN